jgi:hypothetical protein
MGQKREWRRLARYDGIAILLQRTAGPYIRGQKRKRPNRRMRLALTLTTDVMSSTPIECYGTLMSALRINREGPFG